jgi:hypothetical protein
MPSAQPPERRSASLGCLVTAGLFTVALALFGVFAMVTGLRELNLSSNGISSTATVTSVDRVPTAGKQLAHDRVGLQWTDSTGGTFRGTATAREITGLVPGRTVFVRWLKHSGGGVEVKLRRDVSTANGVSGIVVGVLLLGGAVAVGLLGRAARGWNWQR